jgi:hypothetical protein
MRPGAPCRRNRGAAHQEVLTQHLGHSWRRNRIPLADFESRRKALVGREPQEGAAGRAVRVNLVRLQTGHTSRGAVEKKDARIWQLYRFRSPPVIPPVVIFSGSSVGRYAWAVERIHND